MTHRLFRVLAPALAAVALSATACTDSAELSVEPSGSSLGPTSPGPRTTDLSSDDIVLTSALETVDSCDALLERIKAEALERVGPYGFNQGGPQPGLLRTGAVDATEAQRPSGTGPAASTAMADASAGASSAAENNASVGGASESSAPGGTATASAATATNSGTNNQEQGVDEADLVKTDGKRLVVVSGNQLRVIDTTGSTPHLATTITLPDDIFGGQLFLDGDRALLMTTGWTDRPFVGTTVPSDWYPGSPMARLTEIDLGQGKVTRTLDFEGGYLSARDVDGSIRIVLSASADRFAFVYPSNDNATEGAEAANRALIERSTIDQWLPTYEITEDGATVSSGPVVECSRVHLPQEFAGFGSVILLTVVLSQGLQITDAVSVFTDAQTVYASPATVAVATPRWPTIGPNGQLSEDNGDNYTTAIHTFDISDPSRARYVASGSAPGHLLSQYSLSEYDGYLRVATTAGSPWWGGGGGSSESFVTVLAEDGNVLRQVGQVGGLGQGEEIFAVRFLDDQGYVVTFQQTDPLYTVDLSDPTNPRVAGELKIPGFSSYLHPLDDDHLLGVGTDGNELGATGGTVLSLFDVSDPANPSRTAKLALNRPGEGREVGSSSLVATDAKAFTYWEGRAVVPVSWWAYSSSNGSQTNGSDAVVVSVDPAGDLQELGRISHPLNQSCSGGVAPGQPVPIEGDRAVLPGPQPCFIQAPEIQRSVVIGPNLFTVSDAGVGVNQFDSLQSVTWIPFH